MCVHCNYRHTEPVLPNLQQPLLISLQDLPNLLVRSSQVVIRFYLNICTAEVVGTGRHLPHLYFPSKVVLTVVAIPFSTIFVRWLVLCLLPYTHVCIEMFAEMFPKRSCHSVLQFVIFGTFSMYYCAYHIFFFIS